MYVYIHIPFCLRICNYCDFPKILYDKKYVLRYLESLKKEIELRYQKEKVKSIYIGGGTPTSLDLDELEYLLDITNIFQRDELIEFTIESNIESLNIDKMQLLKKYGVNRVSLGVQSFQKNILKELGRSHQKEMVQSIVLDLKKCGFSNLSMDYIYGVHSDLEEVRNDIQSFLELDISHISCYSLIVEDGTVFGIDNRKYIEEDLEYEMYQYIESELTKNGYKHYEISNYCKTGYESIHNLNYWENGEYYGFGMGAVSFLDNVRISNTKNFTKYIHGEYILDEVYEDIDTRISNEFILGLRKLGGICIQDFFKKYQKDILTLYHVEELLSDGKLEIKDGFLRISSKYFYLANEILIDFI